jgi:hypothetical protein
VYLSALPNQKSEQKQEIYPEKAIFADMVDSEHVKSEEPLKNSKSPTASLFRLD